MEPQINTDKHRYNWVKVTNYIRVYLCLSVVSFPLCSCQPVDNQRGKYVEFTGRESKDVIYRIAVPDNWIVQLPTEEQDLTDSRNPLISLKLNGIHLTIHNFPYTNIPPQAQITRWQRQFTSLDPSLSTTIPQAFSGYVGLLFDGVGILNDQATMILGWAMQVGTEHQRKLPTEDLRSNFTIKTLGPVSEMEAEKDSIIRIARSFEMINPIPSP